MATGTLSTGLCGRVRLLQFHQHEPGFVHFEGNILLRSHPFLINRTKTVRIGEAIVLDLEETATHRPLDREATLFPTAVEEGALLAVAWLGPQISGTHTLTPLQT